MTRACARCGQPTKLNRRRHCSKRCAGLAQNEARRNSGEDVARFWSNVDRRGPSECWPWAGGTCEGYGAIRFRGYKTGSHRVSFLLRHGALPPNGLMVLHRCGNRRCCNPDHLYAGTHADNTNDAIQHGTYKTVFVPGHPCFRRTA